MLSRRPFVKGAVACVASVLPVLSCFAVTAQMTRVGNDEIVSYTVERGEDWVPVDYFKGVQPGSALDFSDLGLQDAPAGKHGWLKTRDGHFIFEDTPSVVRRFCGPNLCFDGCCPLLEDADAFADRLMRLGYNSVRFHHFETSLLMGDGGWGSRPDWHRFAPEKIDRFDRFVAALLKRGIYITTDLYVGRVVLWGEVGETMEHHPNNWIDPKYLFKAFSMIETRAWENWRDFARMFLSHRNPYTGRTYAEEPGMPLLCLINENSLSPAWETLRQHSVCKLTWKNWLVKERDKDPGFLPGVTDDLSAADAPGPGSAAFNLFTAYVEARFFRRASRFLREELGVKALLTSQNNGGREPPLQAVRERYYDYVDAHHYDSHPLGMSEAAKAPGAPKEFKAATRGCNPGQVTWIGGAASAFTRLSDLPLVFTESDFSYPAPWRSSYGLMMGAIGGMQGFDGVWRYCWSLDWNNKCRELKDDYHSPMRSFDQLCDPISLASDRFTSLLFLRGDVPHLREPGIVIRYSPDTMKRDGSHPDNLNSIPLGLSWLVSIATCVEKPAPKGWKDLTYGEISELKARGCAYPVEADPNRAFVRDETNNCIRLATRRSCGGFAHPESGCVRAGALDFEVKDSYASVLAASVDPVDVSLVQSRRILVLHLTEMLAEGSKVTDCRRPCETYRYLTEVGTNAVVRSGRCAFSLRLEHPDAYKVFALDTMGRRLDAVPVSVRDGRLSFEANVRGPDGNARFHYEVVR